MLPFSPVSRRLLRHQEPLLLFLLNADVARDTNGVTQCLVAIIIGLAMAKTRRYKWVCVSGAVIRLIGYGVMLRLRGSENSIAEITVVQLIQGIGSGMVGSTLLIPAQVVVTHSEMPQMTALIVCFAFVGGSVGSCIAGGIYTGTIESELWHYLGSSATAETVASLANSITGVLPEWGTPDRTALNFAVRFLPLSTPFSPFWNHLSSLLRDAHPMIVYRSHEVYDICGRRPFVHRSYRVTFYA